MATGDDMTIGAAGTQAPELYWEARGSGSAVLLVPGTPGDGGQFEALAHALAQDHLVITFDRRGTSRSARRSVGEPVSVADHADDAAVVLTDASVEQALVFGTSNGALVALELALRHPNRVVGAILHEPPLLSVIDDPQPVGDAMGAVIGGAMKSGGPREALNAFLRFAYGDEIVSGWSEELRERMLSNAEAVFTTELPAFQSYRPDADDLRRCAVPVELLVGASQPMPFFREAAEWLAENLGARVAVAPGAHGPQFSDPVGLARTIREFHP
jgi:pimeloyl-ACP methyl ester carboxylesterase